MSDFGTMVIFLRKDGEDIGENEVETLIDFITAKAKEIDITDFMGEPLAFMPSSFSSDDESCEGVSIILTEYWMDEEMESQYMDISTEDADNCKPLLDIVQKEFENTYKIEFYHGDW
ncbi:MAG: hypothetical protein GY714_31345 [Desulfobacterales bacterium]|nr:hypothetical protein [Desulfobacterales bacterium]MCP4159415.1 hypothetical protein [Deltaproteobacteria bacterium]